MRSSTAEVFATNLRHRRAELGLSQADLAARIGMTQTAVSYWESGKRQPSFADLDTLAGALGTDAADLLADTICPVEMWSLVACGRVADGAQDELASRLGELLSAPQYGTQHTDLVIGSGPAVKGLHVPGERVPEPAGA